MDGIVEKAHVLLVHDVASGRKVKKGKTSKQELYGLAGERVRIVTLNMPAVIVENAKGVRFPTSVENVKVADTISD